MSWRTNNIVLNRRNLGRAIGMNRWISLWLQGNGYEVRYDQQCSACIGLGDCGWDVGAKIGYYTRLSAERVGQEGSVVSFEPSPVNFSWLSKR